MSDVSTTLIQFRDDELIFDENETREILKFFWPENSSQIDGMIITNDVRAFAQGLVVEGVDSSYGLGFVQDILSSVLNPGRNVQKFLMKLGKKALPRWFKHVKYADLHRAKLAEAVRRVLASNFAPVFGSFLGGNTSAIAGRRFAATPIHRIASVRPRTLWG